ncbi:hypothetical protein FACS18949_15480 [Clostridia bacterium]|nr:hypothetical protein FACS18949_15480 [Clostridia bacterium]
MRKKLTALIFAAVMALTLLPALAPQTAHAVYEPADNVAAAINTFNHGGTGTLTAVAVNSVVTVSGNVSGATNQLAMNLGTGVLVKWEATYGGSTDSGALIDISGDGTFEVWDGSITQTAITSNEHAIAAAGNVGVYGGLVSAIDGFAIDTDGGVTVGGGTVTSAGMCTIYAEGNVTVEGGTVSSSCADGAAIAAVGNVTVSDGTVSSTGEYSLTIATEGDVTVSGGTVSSTGEGAYTIFARGYSTVGGNVTVSGGATVSATGSGSMAIISGLWDNTDIVGGNVTVSGSGTTVSARDNSAILAGGDVMVSGGATVTNTSSTEAAVKIEGDYEHTVTVDGTGSKIETGSGGTAIDSEGTATVIVMDHGAINAPNGTAGGGTGTYTFLGDGTGTVTDNSGTTSPLTMYSISLSVTGTHTFPGAVYGYAAQTPKSVTVTNTGNDDTGGLVVELSGANASSFTTTDNYNGDINIAPGATKTFNVTPKTGLAVGTYTATVTVSGWEISESFNVSFTVSSGTNDPQTPPTTPTAPPTDPPTPPTTPPTDPTTPPTDPPTPPTTPPTVPSAAPTAAPKNPTAPVGGGETSVEYTKDGDTVTIIVDDTKIADILKDDDVVVTIDFSGVPGVTAVVIPRELAEAIKNAGKSLEIILPNGTLIFNALMLTAIGEKLTANFKVTVKITSQNPLTIELSVNWGGVTFSDFGGLTVAAKIPFTLPDGVKSTQIVVYYLNADGGLEMITGVYNPITKTIDMTLRHLSKYVIKVNDVKYTVGKGWYNAESLDFAVQRGLVTVTNGIVEPTGETTRADFVISALKVLGIQPYKEFTVGQFSDVGHLTAIQQAYLRTARELGVIGGVGDNKFDPDSPALREHFFQIVNNIYAAKLLATPKAASSKTIADFTDGASVPAWAIAATNELIMRGVIQGDGSKLQIGAAFNNATTAVVLAKLGGVIPNLPDDAD